MTRILGSVLVLALVASLLMIPLAAQLFPDGWEATHTGVKKFVASRARRDSALTPAPGEAATSVDVADREAALHIEEAEATAEAPLPPADSLDAPDTEVSNPSTLAPWIARDDVTYTFPDSLPNDPAHDDRVGLLHSAASTPEQEQALRSHYLQVLRETRRAR